MREWMSPVYHASLNLFTRRSPFLDEKPKKKEEVNVLGDQERKVEQKKVDRWNPGGQLIRQVVKVVKLFSGSLPITADLVPFVGVGGEEVGDGALNAELCKIFTSEFFTMCALD